MYGRLFLNKYTFDRWEGTYTNVQKNEIVKAIYKETKNTYKVVWKNYNGEILETDNTVEYGTIPTYDGEEPTRASTEKNSYEFTGWDPEIKAVEGNQEYTAQFKENLRTYTVTWENSDRTIIKIDT